MPEELIISTRSLKDLLILFDPEEEISGLSLGDTWHPSSGFVDEKILHGKNRVRELLEFDYDYRGLVEFYGRLADLSVSLVTSPGEDRELQKYKVSGTKKELRSLKEKAVELNSYQENRYRFDTSNKY